MPRRLPLAVAGLAALVTACGPSVDYASVDATSTPTATPAAHRQAKLRRARCPAHVPRCVTVTGPVVYVEATDPDGDGDAHYVLAAGHVTGRGLTILKIGKALRPRHLARAGDLVSAAGTITTGSRDEHELKVLVLHQARR